MNLATLSNVVPVDFRAHVKDDEPFIISSYLQSHRHEGTNRHMANPVYYGRHVPIAERLARKASVLVACSVEEPWHIYGSIAHGLTDAGELVVHYAYVKYPMRRLGLARRLFQLVNAPRHASVIVTHTGRAFEALRERYGLVFQPEWRERT